ncbi:hypothetical protein MRX96_021113 [Rhipicephalus microplus]
MTVPLADEASSYSKSLSTPCSTSPYREPDSSGARPHDLSRTTTSSSTTASPVTEILFGVPSPLPLSPLSTSSCPSSSPSISTTSSTASSSGAGRLEVVSSGLTSASYSETSWSGAEDPEVCPLSQPRRRLLPQGSQEKLSLEGLPLPKLPPGWSNARGSWLRRWLSEGKCFCSKILNLSAILRIGFGAVMLGF